MIFWFKLVRWINRFSKESHLWPRLYEPLLGHSCSIIAGMQIYTIFDVYVRSDNVLPKLTLSNDRDDPIAKKHSLVHTDCYVSNNSVRHLLWTTASQIVCFQFEVQGQFFITNCSAVVKNEPFHCFVAHNSIAQQMNCKYILTHKY